MASGALDRSSWGCAAKVDAATPEEDTSERDMSEEDLPERNRGVAAFRLRATSGEDKQVHSAKLGAASCPTNIDEQISSAKAMSAREGSSPCIERSAARLLDEHTQMDRVFSGLLSSSATKSDFHHLLSGRGFAAGVLGNVFMAG